MLNHPTPHDSTAPTLALHHVSVHYGPTVALNNLSFTVEPGTHAAVVGPNGAGKSTLFNLIAGTIAPTQGQVDIFGSQPQRHLCIGYVPQRSQIDARFPVSVWDVVMMGRVGQIGFFRRARGVDREAVEAALRQVDMLNLQRRQIGELSGGQQQRVFLARALAQGAELLLLDEPLSGAGCAQPGGHSFADYQPARPAHHGAHGDARFEPGGGTLFPRDVAQTGG